MTDDMKNRKHIPREIARRVQVESGLKCAVPQCSVQWPTLQYHHIDEDPSNNDAANLLLLCPTHHQMVTSGHLDRKTCESLKQLVRDISNLEPSQDTPRRNRLLRSLIAELHANLILFSDESFHDLSIFRVYPRFRHIVLDQSLASGAFVFDLDDALFSLLYDWARSLDDLNRRLDISEIRDFGRLSEEKIAEIRSQIVNGPAFGSSRCLCKSVLTYLIKCYGAETGITTDTTFFGKSIAEVLRSVPDNDAK